MSQSSVLEGLGIALLVSAVVSFFVARYARPGSVLQILAELFAFILLWYTVSIGLTLLNKYLFSFFDDGRFHFPISMTSIHLFLQFSIAMVLLELRQRLPEGWTGLSVGDVARGKRVRAHLAQWPVFFRYCAPVSVATAGDIALSNVSVLHVPVSVYTIGKSTLLVFNLLLSVYFGLQRWSTNLGVVIVLIVFGVIFAAYTDEEEDRKSNLVGVLCAVGAAIMGAGRWAFTERLFREVDSFLSSSEETSGTADRSHGEKATDEEVAALLPSAATEEAADEESTLSDTEAPHPHPRHHTPAPEEEEAGAAVVATGEEERRVESSGEEVAPLAPSAERPKRPLDPITLFSLVAPLASGLLVAPAAGMEGVGLFASEVWAIPSEAVVATFGILGGGLVAFVLIWTEMHVIHRTSSLTTTVIGHVKELLVIILSIVIYNDRVLPINVIGMILAFGGTGLYIYVKHKDHELPPRPPIHPPSSDSDDDRPPTPPKPAKTASV